MRLWFRTCWPHMPASKPVHWHELPWTLSEPLPFSPSGSVLASHVGHKPFPIESSQKDSAGTASLLFLQPDPPTHNPVCYFGHCRDFGVPDLPGTATPSSMSVTGHTALHPRLPLPQSFPLTLPSPTTGTVCTLEVSL